MEIRHLSFSYGKKEILKDISLSFAEGKITTLLGANAVVSPLYLSSVQKTCVPKEGLSH